MGNEQSGEAQTIVANTESLDNLPVDDRGIKLISASHLAGHDSEDSCWVCIHGRVYNVTNFLSEHPGGGDIILDASGAQDASEEFDNVKHSQTALDSMNKYFIGKYSK